VDSRPQRLLLEKAKRHRYSGLRPRVLWRMANSKKSPEQDPSVLSARQNRATLQALL
jgi:hypothetical protein